MARTEQLAADWEENAQAAFNKYLAALKEDLGPNASFADMEQAILKHSPQIMQQTLQSLAASQAFSPGEETNT